VPRERAGAFAAAAPRPPPRPVYTLPTHHIYYTLPTPMHHIYYTLPTAYTLLTHHVYKNIRVYILNVYMYSSLRTIYIHIYGIYTACAPYI